MNGLKDQHRRDIADQVRKQGGENAEGAGAIQVKAAGGGKEIGGERRLLQPRDHDEEADEEDEQAPIDLPVDLFRFDAAGEQEQRARDDRYLGTGHPAKKKTIIPADTASDFHNSGRFTRTGRCATWSGAVRRNSAR